uniref:30S ribosomal protein S17 n=1 Tax=Nephromyces sp. ex Molgula occidentalis TaxID=2544991 RepID=A0A5C1H7L3_9APIC|nr:30S ribosomal protein S17 [Nephromyces sp. ex Molgula occidentalis]
MNKIYKGLVIYKTKFNFLTILYPNIKFNKKYNIKYIKYNKFLLKDSRNEAFKGDWVLFKIISPKSKFIYYKIIKII